MLEFRKMHGLGNDFVILDARGGDLGLEATDMARIADRNLGIGCDQIAVLHPSATSNVFVRFYNADGSESGACGNASRCVADIILSETDNDTCALELTYGAVHCRKVGGLIEVNMGAPKAIKDLTLSYGGVSDPVSVDMGNPHCVFFVDDLGAIDIPVVGAYFENHNSFPNRTNVEFVEVRGKESLRQITWERGAGITLACGSGACAVAVAAFQRGLTQRTVNIELDGGDLMIEYRAEDGCVIMTGPVTYVFDGKFAV